MMLCDSPHPQAELPAGIGATVMESFSEYKGQCGELNKKFQALVQITIASAQLSPCVTEMLASKNPETMVGVSNAMNNVKALVDGAALETSLRTAISTFETACGLDTRGRDMCIASLQQFKATSKELVQSCLDGHADSDAQKQKLIDTAAASITASSHVWLQQAEWSDTVDRDRSAIRYVEDSVVVVCKGAMQVVAVQGEHQPRARWIPRPRHQGNPSVGRHKDIFGVCGRRGACRKIH